MSDDDTTDRLLDLLAAWQDGRDAGGEPTPEQLCPEDAVLRERLRTQISRIKKLEPPPGPDDTAPDLPGYRLAGELGRGSFGVVFRGRQLGLNREVAVKVLTAGGRAGAARFLAEAEAVAAAEHPNVVRVYDTGVSGGRHFLALEFCDGGTLADKLKAGRLPAAEAAAVLEAVADGVAAAHARQIVHRDLKPGNVLFAGGVPKVADFGLAKTAAGPDLTATHAVMGTPAYMAPEQASGGTKFVGPAADVWALGVMLYECLGGRKPFTAGDTLSLLEKVRTAEPAGLRSVERSVPRGLELVTLKCLRKEPSERYPTAAELAADLGRWRRGEPVTARPAGRVERVARWVQRNPAATAAYSLATLAAILSVGVLSVAGLWRRAEGARQLAVQAQSELGVEREKLARLEYLRTVRVAHQEWRDNNQSVAQALLATAPPERKGWEWFYVNRLCNQELTVLRFRAGPVRTVAFSSDGRRVLTVSEIGVALVWDAATGTDAPFHLRHRGRGYDIEVEAAAFSPDGQRVATVSEDGNIRLWDAATGAELVALGGHEGNVRQVVFTPDGRRLMTVGDDCAVRAWPAARGASPQVIRPKVPESDNGSRVEMRPEVFSPDRRRLVTTGNDGTARVFDTETGAEVAVLRGHEQQAEESEFTSPYRVRAASFSPDGGRVVTAGIDGTARVWDAKTGAEVRVLRGHTGRIWRVEVAPDGRVMTAGTDGTTRVWDTVTGVGLVVKREQTGTVTAAAFSPDGRLVATAGKEGTLRVWDAATGVESAELRGHGLAGPEARAGTPPIQMVCFSADGRRLATAGGDGTARVWRAAGAESLVLRGHGGDTKGAALTVLRPVLSATIAADGGHVVTAGADSTTRVWDATTGAELHVLRGHKGTVKAALSADGRRVMTAASDGTARVWDAATGAELVILQWNEFGGGGFPPPSAFAPDGRSVLVVGSGGVAKLWDVATGAVLHEMPGHDDSIRTPAFSPDGRRISIPGRDNSARVWDTTSGRELVVLRGHDKSVWTTAFSPDGERVVTAGADGTARVWDIATGAELAVLRGHEDEILWSAVFSPDGRQVLTTGRDYTARLWDAATGVEKHTLRTPGEYVVKAAFSPDGQRVATAGRDGTIRVWDAASGAEALALRGHEGTVSAVAFSSDGRRLLTSGSDGTARLWDAGPVALRPAKAGDGPPAPALPLDKP